MIDAKGRFVIENYAKKGEFASFLPGISGMYGIPIWCYYVNRGQCITSFGVQDKDHSIMEFYPAYQAYVQTKRLGFRTFIKTDGEIRQPFGDERMPHAMHIGMNELELKEEDTAKGIKTDITYITLPGEEVGGLVRRVRIRNVSESSRHLEVLDGMPAVIPYGVSLESMKEMGQTMTAWMEVQDLETNVPFFHVRASTQDTAQVTQILGGNYGMAIDEKGEPCRVIVDPQAVFAYDSSFDYPVRMGEMSLEELCGTKQVTQNRMPCCFFAKEAELAPGEELVLYELYGQSESKEILESFRKKVQGTAYFEEKFPQAAGLAEEITDMIATKTGSQVFDCYCRQTFLDNVLRGGYPVQLPGGKLFYLYSRKHGDTERDYNYFSMLPEFFSQGNGNFRDVNQNRRCDVQFAPFVGERNIRTFYNCIQINGYNPLGIEKITYKTKDKTLPETFTPGELYRFLEERTESGEELYRQFAKALKEAEYEDRTRFIEGYWTDHWTYNLDLLESYLTVYPERERKLLFGEASYTWLQSKEEILPRAKRYTKTENGIRQYQFLVSNPRAEKMYLTDTEGNVVKNTLAEKLFVLCTVKTAALDAFGMGIEMEGGKPGWYDALNGLPGLLGSSMCETYEVARVLEYVISLLERYDETLRIPQEAAELASRICDAVKTCAPEAAEGTVLDYWNSVCDAKECYWKETENSICSEQTALSSAAALALLKEMQKVVKRGIEKALAAGDGISPAYFYYEVSAYTEDDAGIHPTQMEQHMLPYFLEGPVRHLKLSMETDKKEKLYRKVKNSDLYDRVLNMYKVNASLQDTTFELGRCRAFTPGWLENESVWLHMEYKYLLELLKSGLYGEFLDDFQKAAVPFLDPQVYGRSLFENSSFIASSANPNPAVHGKGFVARLSGSTAEFLQMWQIMMFGRHPFTAEEGTLSLRFLPLIPEALIGEDRTIEAAFLGGTKVVYHFSDRKDHIPGNYRVTGGRISWKDGTKSSCGAVICGEEAEKIRGGAAERIELNIDRI